MNLDAEDPGICRWRGLAPVVKPPSFNRNAQHIGAEEQERRPSVFRKRWRTAAGIGPDENHLLLGKSPCQAKIFVIGNPIAKRS